MAEMRKLMLISPMLHQGGFERVCVTTARLLAPYFDITIVIFDSADIAYDVSGLNIIDLKLGVQRGRLKKLFNIFRRSRRLKMLKRKLQPEIAYSFGPTANLTNIFSKTKKTKTWVGLRNYTDVEETIKIKLFTLLADRIICCSKAIQKSIEIKFKYNKTDVLYNLYDIDSMQKEANAGTPELPWGERDEAGRKIFNLISMGRDDDMKGFWHMLKTFAIVHEDHPEARLILLGAGSFGHYRKLAEDLGVSDAVYFAGMQKEPYQFLKKAEIYLLTSLNEGFPNALVEGMAMGLAAVAVDCMTGPAEILLGEQNGGAFFQQDVILNPNEKTNVIYGEYGILLPAMSKKRDLDAGNILPEERNMATVIIELLEKKEFLYKYQNAAKNRAGIFTYEHYIKEFLRLSCEET